MRKILAVDFDDTISTYHTFPEYGTPKKGVKEALSRLIKKYEIIIYTCRMNLKNPNRGLHHNGIEIFLAKHQIPYDKIDLGLQGKIIADFYIDDRAIAFENNWDEITEALEAEG